MAIAHTGLASLAVDLHEVGDLLALTNSLVQLHNLVGGFQVTLLGKSLAAARVLGLSVARAGALLIRRYS